MLTILSLAVLEDLQENKISNRLILCGLAAGCVLRLIQYGPAGIVISIFHITIPVILLFLLFQAHVIGAGDIKLFSITGIFLTTEQLLKVMLLSFFIAAIYGAGKIGYLALKGKKMQDGTKICFSAEIFIAVCLIIGG